MAQLVQASGGSVRRVRTASEVRRGLLDSLRGESAPIAERVELIVDFNPNAVAGYRLIGHESRGWGAFGSAVVSTEMWPGEEVTSLFELWMHPNDEDNVATARLVWLDPQDPDRSNSDSIRISRLQFSSTFEGMPVSLQGAAMITEAAEVLSQSFNFEVVGTGGYRYAPKPRDLRHVFQALERANPQLRERADFERAIGLMRAADQISVERSVASTRSGTRGIIAGRWRESRE
jgi:hypothetical protein